MLLRIHKRPPIQARNTAKILVASSFILVFISVLPLVAEAATLYLTPSSDSIGSSQTFNVNINVSSADQAMNAVQGVLTFPPENLSVIGVSKVGSIIGLWVQDPTFNNSTGRVNFEGVVLNPGFIGSAGRVLQITFKAKAEGSATVSLTSASVLANDGRGTNILSQLGNGRYLIEAAVVAPRLPEPDVRFIISFPDGVETTNPRPRVKLEVQNLKTAVDHYEIKVDNRDFKFWKDEGTSIYIISELLDLGKHTIVARAYYSADKFLEATKGITITGLAKPEIIDYPRQLSSGDTLIIGGKTYPNSKITVYIQKDIDQPISYTAKSDDTGEFNFLYDKRTSTGVYKFWADVQNEGGAKSDITEKFIISVREAAIIRIGSTLINAVTFIIVLASLLLFLVFISMYGWYKFRSFRKKVDKEVVESEVALRKAFKALKGDVVEQLDKLEQAKLSRELTREEKDIRKTLLSHLDVAERFIEKEIRDIEEVVLGNHHEILEGGGAFPAKKSEEIKKEQEIKKREDEVKTRAEKIQKHLKAAEKYIEKKVKDIDEEVS
ncbi:MAG: hypothetical protein Q7S73_01880 [bacterium]|nr:hypothetical protein [bacterium]